jgi:uncharacterized protein (DUF433 family)
MALAFDIGSLLDSDPGFYAGRPFIRGRRVTVQRIAILFKQGFTPTELAEDLNLVPEQVHAALAYYHANRDAIDADIEEQDAEYDRLAAEQTDSLADRLRVTR